MNGTEWHDASVSALTGKARETAAQQFFAALAAGDLGGVAGDSICFAGLRPAG